VDLEQDMIIPPVYLVHLVQLLSLSLSLYVIEDGQALATLSTLSTYSEYMDNMDKYMATCPSSRTQTGTENKRTWTRWTCIERGALTTAHAARLFSLTKGVTAEA
jgi:hypothetical protein